MAFAASTDAFALSLRFALRPIVRCALRRSYRLLEVIEILKAVFLEVAAEELQKEGEMPNVSKLSVMTGVHRKDATRLFRDRGEPRQPLDTLSRIVGLWRNSPRYTTKQGAARVLSGDGSKNEFFALVREVTSDVAPHTVLNELQRRGMVETSPRGIRLTTGRVTTLPQETVEGFRMLGEDVGDLLAAGEENLSSETNDRHLHLKTEFDNIPLSAAETVKSWLRKEGSLMHERVERFLAQLDRDVTPTRSIEPAVRVAFGSFAYVDRPISIREN